MKIVYCLNSISHFGGIATVITTKANALADIEGNQVYVCVSDYVDSYLSRRLSPKVNLINLDINYYQDDWKSRWHLLRATIIKRHRHKKALKETLNSINPDIVISAGQSEKYFLPKIKGKWKSIREIHFVTNYRDYIAFSAIEKLVNKLITFYDFRWKIRSYDHVVLLTHEDRQRNWNNKSGVSVIPNPLTIVASEKAALDSKKIITLGRFVYQKDYPSLIRAYSIVANRYPDWKLIIYGDGSQEQSIRKQIASLKLTDKILLPGVTESPVEALAEASLFVLSSKFEGFGLTIIEAMAVGLPVVSYECPCGPKDVISDGRDGFLVKTGDEQALAEKIIYLIENPQVRKQMGAAAKLKSLDYSIERITQMWMELFNSLIENRK
ncbi:MAG: glycosyltransferase family 4 protein [Muribaculaceae bacterium]|nr:glycosyltransferase family 4 protein [Muribaculaceae bacterium]